MAMMSVHTLEVRTARLEGICEQIDKRLDNMAAVMDSRFSDVDARFGRLEQKTDALQWRLTSLILVTWVSTMLAIFFRH